MARMDPGQLERDGYVVAGPLLSPELCRTVLARFTSRERPPPADWGKGAAVTDWLLHRIAADPAIVDLVAPLLGNDIILWGCSLVRSRAGHVHPWHADIECTVPRGRFVSVWIGLEHTRGNALHVISGSHRVGKTVQQEQAERGYSRGAAPTEAVLEWVREHYSAAACCEPDVGDGEPIVFDGALWHGSNNRSPHTRSALLLQYASADSSLRLPGGKFEWPFEFAAAPTPPAVVVRGSASADVNRLYPPPAGGVQKGSPMLSALIRPIGLPLAEHPEGGWQRYPLFNGSTPVLDTLTCHVSVLSGGHSPHPQHEHDNEELLIILDGEAELLIANGPYYDGEPVRRVKTGDFVYYPVGQRHTIRNPGDEPATYLMFKWHAGGTKTSDGPLRTSIFHFGEAATNAADGWARQKIFEQATGWLGRLQCHCSRLEPGAGYEPHVDAYDVAILTLSGTLETLGQEVGPGSVIYYSEGQKHGMRNVGDEPAHYLVFEFHPAAFDMAQWLRWRAKPFAKRAIKRAANAAGVDLHRLRRRLRSANA